MVKIRTIAVIPARGGSKGIPGKNLIDFCGKPLVAWSIIQAKNSREIDEVLVSSDSAEILEVSEKYGATPIVRPDDISGDFASSESAVAHAVSKIEYPVDAIIMLQATSPLRKNDDLDRAVAFFRQNDHDSIFSGAVLEDFLIWEKDKKGDLQSLNYNHLDRSRRQDREIQFVENGSFYIFRPEVLQKGNRLGNRIGVFLMEFWQSFEIDTLEDLELVRVLFEKHLL